MVSSNLQWTTHDNFVYSVLYENWKLYPSRIQVKKNSMHNSTISNTIDDERIEMYMTNNETISISMCVQK